MAGGAWTREALDLAGGEEWLDIPVAGRSMHPLILGGDRVRVATRRTAAPGDVVAIRRGEDLLVHRIVGMQGGHLLEMGDAELRACEVLAGELLGVAVAVRSRRGRLFRLDSAVARRHGQIAAALLRAGRRRPAPIRRGVGYLVRLTALGVRLGAVLAARSPTPDPKGGTAGA
jgi:hypothetical protein